MYSGSTLRNSSGRIIGAHQKLDRVARRALEKIVPGSDFPSIREILHFEGMNGPDGIKRKSPAQDEPWHYYDPTNPGDVTLPKMIAQHSKNLTIALNSSTKERAAFEAAWQAHAIVDGLTPAHHYPLEEKLEELRGEGLETRITVKDKLIIKSEGDTKRQMFAKNWEYWGAKGVMTTHLLFEIGVATTIAPLRLHSGYPTPEECRQVLDRGIAAIFKDAAQEVYALKMYERFSKDGWTSKLASETRKQLAPIIVRTIALAWYEAYMRAGVK